MGAPTVVFMQVRTQLLKFCKEALVEIKTAKALSSSPVEKPPVGFLQIRQDPAPEDALAKEMTHDLEMNFNKIAPSARRTRRRSSRTTRLTRRTPSWTPLRTPRSPRSSARSSARSRASA